MRRLDVTYAPPPHMFKNYEYDQKLLKNENLEKLRSLQKFKKLTRLNIVDIRVADNSNNLLSPCSPTAIHKSPD